MRGAPLVLAEADSNVELVGDAGAVMSTGWAVPRACWSPRGDTFECDLARARLRADDGAPPPRTVELHASVYDEEEEEDDDDDDDVVFV